MRLTRNLNAPWSLDIWRHLVTTPGVMAAAGAIACSCSTPGESIAPDTTSAPAPTTISQEQPDAPLPECVSLTATMVGSDPATYQFKSVGKNLHADFVHTPTALVIDFGDGSDVYDSSELGLGYNPSVPVGHEFPESEQQETYRVTSGIRMHVMDGQHAPTGVGEGTIIGCPVREITVAPSS